MTDTITIEGQDIEDAVFEEIEVPKVPSVPMVTMVYFDIESGGVEYTASTSEDTLLFKGMTALAEGKGMIPLPEGMSEAEMQGKCVDFDTQEIWDQDEFELWVEGNVISGIPEGTTIVVQSSKGFAIDGVLSISAKYPQRTLIHLIHPAYKDYMQEIDIVPAEHIEGVTHALIENVSFLRRAAYDSDGDKWDLLIKALAQVPMLMEIPEIGELVGRAMAVKKAFPKYDVDTPLLEGPKQEEV
jgi:hypothetical protein